MSKRAAFTLATSYVIGSVAFIGGSILFHPHFSVDDTLFKLGVSLFIVGSVLFLLPALYEWHANFLGLLSYHATPNYNPVSDYDLPSDYILRNHGVNITRSTISVLNGILFTIGSIAYWPTFERVGVVTGNWLFRMGSSFTLLSCIWAFSRTFSQSHHTRGMRQLLRIFFFQFILGAIGFLDT
ncbi:hypothetical protein PROFUN_05938 [Planoprotostelium fungivorum]|uniref:YrhK domain-containing protein n=1 Tax=Planoprotostelium fungivorum TaxID=1890364 RepID=A0A2P6N7M8_9EUKA|nr:hypothetical protein PROFUN_05938 [Planoprotostelium fungivorum]